MDNQAATSPAAPSAQVVGNAFVEQYYHILHHSPESVYKFYQESSILSRPDADGVIEPVTTMKGINEKICSLDYKNYKAEIKSADSQESYMDGFIVLVTGFLTGGDNVRRKFAQTFFLAPQDKGYFVLNDVFRFVEESEPLEDITVTENGTQNPSLSLNPDPEPAHVLDQPIVDQPTSHAEKFHNIEEKNHDPEQERQLIAEKELSVEVEVHSNENQDPAVAESVTSVPQKDVPKKSYASILSSQAKRVPTKVYVPAKKTDKQSVSVPQASPPEASAASAPTNTNGPETRNSQDEAEGHSIYVRNLPLNATAAELEVEFKKFGAIKEGGVQVRSSKQHGFCFGFVEFLDLSSMQTAIQASPITIGGRPAAVEIKRTTTRVGGTRDRYPSGGRGGFRNDSFRGRGNFGGVSRGYGRSDFGGREFAGQGRSLSGRIGEGYQQGRGRGRVAQ